MDSSSYFKANKERIISEWKELLSIPSISGDKSFHPDCLRCVGWLKDHLGGFGVRSELLPTSTLPLLFAEIPGDKAKPTVLFYGHYDVQPPDPLELWSSPPFEPEIRNDRMYARGAEDNKGQLFYFVKALEMLLKSGVKLPTIKLLIEGEEESGGAGITEGLIRYRERLKADILMVCDTGSLKAGIPMITMGMRGNIGIELELHGAKLDLHSGIFGGLAPNPAQGMAKLLSTLHDETGAIAVQGYYDDVQAPSDEDKKLAESAPVDWDFHASQIGVELCGGEEGRSPVDRNAFRPTIEINGMGSGYQGPGGKTIIPSTALAKITSRLILGQNAEKCSKQIIDHLKKHTPKGLRLEVTGSHGAGGAISLSANSPVIKHASQVLKRTFKCDPAFVWIGASIPIVGALAAAAGAEPLMIGFGLEEDCIHSPNESFGLNQFQDGFTYVSEYLSSL